MAITRAQIEARVIELQAELANAKATFDRLNGGILDCEHWMSVVDTPSAEKPLSLVTPKEEAV